MTIRELFDQPGVHLSCEVFPPKVFDKVEEAKVAVRDICALSPAYVSVTCGASGSTPQLLFSSQDKSSHFSSRCRSSLSMKTPMAPIISAMISATFLVS